MLRSFLAPRSLALPLLALRMAWRAGRFTWLATMAVAVTAGIVAPLFAWVLREITVDLTRPGPSAVRVAFLVAVAVLLGGLGLAIGDMAGVLAAAAKRRISVAVSGELYAAVNRIQGVGSFEQPAFQDSLRLAERAADETPSALTTMLAMALQGGTAIAGYAGILLLTWPPMLFLVAGACLPVAVAQLLLTKRGAEVTERAMAGYREWFLLRGLLSDPRAVMESRLLGLGEFFHFRMIRSLDQAMTREYAMHRRIGWTQSWLTLAGTLVTAAGAAVVGIEAAHGHVALGNLVMFLAAVSGTQNALTGTVNQMAMTGTSVLLLRHYRDMLGAGADLPVPPHQVGHRVPALRHGIDMRDVWFRYPGDERWVLCGLNAQVPHGRATALVGVNGAGKSTLIKLLCRLYDPQRGSITWDGTDLRDLDPAELRRRLAVTFQDFLTYDLTAGENIGIGDLAAIEETGRITAAAAAVGLDQTIRRLPHGYRTMLSRTFDGQDGTTGTLLSGGQNQRLVLARTLMRDGADLMVLDEPSSGLDAEAEYQIHENLRRLRDGQTSLLVSHRLSAVRHADRILVLDAGRIAEQGTHDQLMTAGRQYAQLFTRQADGYQLAAAGRPGSTTQAPEEPWQH